MRLFKWLLPTVTLTVILGFIYNKGEKKLWDSKSLIVHLNLHKPFQKGHEVQYKKSVTRNAEYFFDVNVHLLKEVSRKTFPVSNYGIHSASKAVPVPLQEGILVGTDTGKLIHLTSDNTPLWSFQVANSNRGIHSTPGVDESSVYFGGYNGNFYRLDRKSGDLLWTIKAGVAVGASPLLIDDFVIINFELPENGFIAKVLRDTGMVIWSSDFLGNQSHSSVSYHAKTDSLLVGDNNGNLRSIDFKSGLIKWIVALGGEVKNAPVIFEDQVYVNTWGKELISVDISSGKVTWRTKLTAKSQSSPVVDSKNRLIISGDFSGTVTAVSVDGKPAWQKIRHSKLKNYGNLLLLNFKNRSYLVYPFENQILFTDPRSGNQLFSVPTSGAITSEFMPYLEKNLLKMNVIPHQGELQEILFGLK